MITHKIKIFIKFMTLFTFLFALPFWLLISQRQDIRDSVQDALRAPDRVVLYSLEPTAPPSAPGARLNHFVIIGQKEIDKSQYTRVSYSILEQIPRWRFSIKTSSCLNSRQAVEIDSGEQKFDFLICYECRKIVVYENGKDLAGLEVSGEPSTLNRILAENGVPLSKSAPQPVHATSPE